MAKLAILMLAIVLTVGAQCVAACGVLPVHHAQEQTTPPAHCHQDPASEDDAAPDTCSHQTFVSEGGILTVVLTLDAGALLVHAGDAAPQIVALPVVAIAAEPAPISSPPAFPPILRI